MSGPLYTFTNMSSTPWQPSGVVPTTRKRWSAVSVVTGVALLGLERKLPGVHVDRRRYIYFYNVGYQ